MRKLDTGYRKFINLEWSIHGKVLIQVLLQVTDSNILFLDIMPGSQWHGSGKGAVVLSTFCYQQVYAVCAISMG